MFSQVLLLLDPAIKIVFYFTYISHQPTSFFRVCIFRLSSLTPKLTKQMRVVVDDFINQLNNALQVRLLNKITVSLG